MIFKYSRSANSVHFFRGLFCTIAREHIGNEGTHVRASAHYTSLFGQIPRLKGHARPDYVGGHVSAGNETSGLPDC